MVDWLWFFAGFSADAVIVTAAVFVAGPWALKRWLTLHLAETIQDFLGSSAFNDVLMDYIHSEAFAKIRVDLIKQFKGGFLGGRPAGLKGQIIGAIARKGMQLAGVRPGEVAAEVVADGNLG